MQAEPSFTIRPNSRVTPTGLVKETPAPSLSSLEALSKKLFLQRALELPIEFITNFGVSAPTIAFLQGLGLHIVEDLAIINDTAVTAIFPAFPEKDALIDLWRDVVVEVSARNLRRSLDKVVVSTLSAGESAGESSGSPKSAPGSSQSFLGSVSKGSVYHDLGECKPCAWFHHREGCLTGADCDFCHVCPTGELRRRKKEKVKTLRNTEISRARDQSS